jgi:hypothetical protein
MSNFYAFLIWWQAGLWELREAGAKPAPTPHFGGNGIRVSFELRQQ